MEQGRHGKPTKPSHLSESQPKPCSLRVQAAGHGLGGNAANSTDLEADIKAWKSGQCHASNHIPQVSPTYFTLQPGHGAALLALVEGPEAEYLWAASGSALRWDRLGFRAGSLLFPDRRSEA